MENIFCLESHIHLCSRHTSAIPAYVIKTCVTWHAISGTRYWGFVSPKLHVSTYRNQQHCWWFHHGSYRSIKFPPITRRGVLELGSSTLGSARYFGLHGSSFFNFRSKLFSATYFCFRRQFFCFRRLIFCFPQLIFISKT